jgi:hypothetical protein
MNLEETQTKVVKEKQGTKAKKMAEDWRVLLGGNWKGQ